MDMTSNYENLVIACVADFVGGTHTHLVCSVLGIPTDRVLP